VERVPGICAPGKVHKSGHGSMATHVKAALNYLFRETSETLFSEERRSANRNLIYGM
jgi:hypothetical protein